MSTLPTINDIRVIETPGSWITKSGGILEVLTKIDNNTREMLFSYDQAELDQVPGDVRGLRIYRVKDIPEGVTGANEWHKIRNELLVVLEGSAVWSCTDITGAHREFTLTTGVSVLTPHHILHAYRALVDHTSLMVVANTLFNPENPATHDSYSAEEFAKFTSQ